MPMSSDPGSEASDELLGRTLTAQAIAYYEALAERLGLNATDLRALELVISVPQVTPGRLAELTGLTTGAVTGILDRLEKAGIVLREADPNDRRRVIVRLRPGRAEQLANALQPLGHATEALLARYAPAERAAIRDYLTRASDAVAQETARLRAASRGGFVGDTYSAPLAGATRGRLIFVSGAPRISMNAAPFGPSASARIIMETSASRLRFDGPASPDELIRASFTGPAPDVRAADGIVTVRYRRRPLDTNSRAAAVELNPSIPWTVELEGGITDLTGGLDGVLLARLELQGGANHIKLDLPAPAGTVAIRISGVASSVVFRRPPEVPVALNVRGGISHLRFDTQRLNQVSGEQRFASTTFEASPNRYEIEVLGGASDVKIGPR
jgi:DNA-binding MarR family transcriptional regulator